MRRDAVRIYLDHNATAPLRPEARDAMVAALHRVGNPSSAHREGAAARRLVEEARAEVAALVGAAPAEIVFTSGATEANNLALLGTPRRPRVVTTAVEHASILEPARRLAREGAALVLVPVDGAGCPAAAGIAAAVATTPALVSVGLANGEIGSVAPVVEIAAALRERDVLVHTDAAQAAGRIAIDARALGVDLLSLSAHKLGGPMGVGALWVRRGVEVEGPGGGPQERARRAGTENVPAIAGFGVAARLARAELSSRPPAQAALRDRLWAGIRGAFPDAVRNGPEAGPMLPNTLNVTLPGVAGESLLVLLDLAGVAASLGSACAAGAPEPSHVLRAIGRDGTDARNGLRLSLGPATTVEEIDRVLEILPGIVARIRAGRAA